MKFDMGGQTLTLLRQQTSSSSQDLGSLLRALVVAAEPLEGRFNGAGRVSFDAFKASADAVTAELDSALSAVLHGQSGLDRSFQQGDEQMADETRSVQGAANFDATQFGSR